MTRYGGFWIYHSREEGLPGTHDYEGDEAGWYFVPVDYEGDLPFSDAYSTRDRAENAAEVPLCESSQD